MSATTSLDLTISINAPIAFLAFQSVAAAHVSTSRHRLSKHIQAPLASRSAQNRRKRDDQSP
jgi:hypothetical protein